MKLKEKILETIALAGGDYVSGEQLAAASGVSRNAVWKAIKSLENEGFIFDAVSGTGYRLSPHSNRLSREIITAGLDTECFGRNMIVLSETDSTNNTAKELAADGAVHGTAVIADRQTAGKGRLGRSFVSPAGKGVYISVIIRPDISVDAAQLITSCAACAAASAVEELCGSFVNIKWVNDLYMNGRKICGILTEASLSLENNSLDYAVIGIGINVYPAEDCFDEELKSRVSSIEAESGVKISRNQLCSLLLNRLEEYLSGIEIRSFLEDYRRRELLTGNMITASYGGETITGKAAGIDNNGSLILEMPDGTVKTISSGEANLCRIKKD